MKTISRILALALIIILTIGVSGCMFQSNKSQMLKHLKDKYNGQEFVVIRTDAVGDWFGNNTEALLYCYPKGGDPEADEVKVKMNLDSKKIRDNYLGILIREELEAELLATISDLPLPMKVYYQSNSSYFDETFDDTKTYADFKERLNQGNSIRLVITIVTTMDGVDQTEKEEYVKQIFDRLVKDGYKNSYHGWVTVLFYPSEVFERVTRGNYYDLSEYDPLEPSPEGHDNLSGTIYDGIVEFHFAE